MVVKSTIGCLLALAGAMASAGCASPPATLELVSVAQKALSDAQAYQAQRHQESMGNLDGLQGGLDAAFDADARLAEAGKIVGSDGAPVGLSSEWVISARKGYAAARDALAGQRQQAQAAHVQQLDNLSAASEALDLAKNLIIQSSSLDAQAKQMLQMIQRKTTHE